MRHRFLQLATALLIISVSLVSCDGHRVAINPNTIAHEAHFDLPAYTVVSRDDNMDREASAWSSYTWQVKLNDALSESDIEKLNELVKKDNNWSFDSAKNMYRYHYDEPESKNYFIEIYIDTNIIKMEYNWYDIFS